MWSVASIESYNLTFTAYLSLIERSSLTLSRMTDLTFTKYFELISFELFDEEA